MRGMGGIAILALAAIVAAATVLGTAPVGALTSPVSPLPTRPKECFDALQRRYDGEGYYTEDWLVRPGDPETPCKDYSGNAYVYHFTTSLLWSGGDRLFVYHVWPEATAAEVLALEAYHCALEAGAPAARCVCYSVRGLPTDPTWACPVPPGLTPEPSPTPVAASPVQRWWDTGELWMGQYAVWTNGQELCLPDLAECD
jgi:hypothetical protein